MLKHNRESMMALELGPLVTLAAALAAEDIAVEEAVASGAVVSVAVVTVAVVTVAVAIQVAALADIPEGDLAAAVHQHRRQLQPVPVGDVNKNS